MPLNWKFPKIYYGWWIVIACFIYSIYCTGVIVYGFTAFFDPLITQFGWSYAQISLAASFRGAESGLISPALGFLVDKWGSKWMLFIGAAITGLGFIILSRINSLGGFYAAFVVVALGVSFANPATISPIAANWFHKRVGLAMGILSAGFAFGGLLIPVIIKLIDSLGWRTALFILGIGALVICLPLSLIVRHKPEPYGYLQDGEPISQRKQTSPGKASKVNNQPVEVEISTKQALKSRTFWHLTIAYTLQYVTISAVIAHIMPYLNSLNIDRSSASFFAAAIPIISILGRLGGGWFSDKLNKKGTAITSFIVIGIGTILFNYISYTTIWLLILAIILFSLSYGSGNSIRAILLRDYFGRGRFATIFGFLLGAVAVGSIIGPFMAGWIFDTFNSYHYAWLAFTVVNIIALILITTTPRINVEAPAASVQAIDPV